MTAISIATCLSINTHFIELQKTPPEINVKKSSAVPNLNPNFKINFKIRTKHPQQSQSKFYFGRKKNRGKNTKAKGNPPSRCKEGKEGRLGALHPLPTLLDQV